MKKSNKENIKIIVATHKEYIMPKSDIYMPLQVGAEGKKDLGYTKDNEGKDNISKKNANFCELTGLYWAWKNLKCDVIGLCHYRRYFSLKKHCGKTKEEILDNILNKEDIKKILEKNDVIVGNYNYFIRNNKKFYGKIHFEKDLDTTRDVINDLYPEYTNSFDEIMNEHKLFICNMFIMSKKNFDDYCKWLFDILFEVEKRTDISNYSSHQKRIYGFISERLFNVWLRKNNNLKIVNVNIVSLEHDNFKTLVKKAWNRILGRKK